MSNNKMNLEQALDLISDVAYDSYKELIDGLPEGSNSEWNYDVQLVMELAEAWQRWRDRQDAIEDPYVVWHFDGSKWSKITKEMYQEDAYKDWYRLTKGCTENHNASFERYYYLGSAHEELEGRHEFEEEDDDDFSIGYLLSKSFGE